MIFAQCLSRTFKSRSMRSGFVTISSKPERYFLSNVSILQVKSIKLIRDRYSNRSKGMGYIEMATQEDAAKALMLNGQKMCTKHKACNCSGFPMKVKRSEAEKNWSAMKERAPPKIQPSTIRVCNLHPQLTRPNLIEVLSLFLSLSRSALRSVRRCGQRHDGSRRAQAVQGQRQHQVPPAWSLRSLPLTARKRLARRDAHGRTGLLRPEAQRAAAAAQRAELEVRGPRGQHHSGPQPPLADDAAHRGEQERPDASGHDEPGE